MHKAAEPTEIPRPRRGLARQRIDPPLGRALWRRSARKRTLGRVGVNGRLRAARRGAPGPGAPLCRPRRSQWMTASVGRGTAARTTPPARCGADARGTCRLSALEAIGDSLPNAGNPRGRTHKTLCGPGTQTRALASPWLQSQRSPPPRRRDYCPHDRQRRARSSSGPAPHTDTSASEALGLLRSVLAWERARRLPAHGPMDVGCSRRGVGTRHQTCAGAPDFPPDVVGGLGAGPWITVGRRVARAFDTARGPYRHITRRTSCTLARISVLSWWYAVTASHSVTPPCVMQALERACSSLRG